MIKRLFSAGCAIVAITMLASCGLASGGGGEGGTVTLRLSHQWPAVDKSGKGDFRSVLAERFAKEVEKRSNGSIKITLHPGNSLIEDPTTQYDAITKKALDLSVFPLDYASGDVPEFSITLMPATVPSHEIAQKWKDAEIGKKVDEMADKNGIKILTWVWNAGAIGAKSETPIVSPDDVKKGSVTRAAGSRVEQMLESVGFGLASMPSSEIYTGMQTGNLDSAITSTGSFSSYRLHEQVKSFTVPTGGYTFWFMFEPLIIGKDQFEKLTPDQQKIIEEVGASLQSFAYEESKKDDERVATEFKDKGVKVVPMDEAAFKAWQDKSKPIWDDFAKSVDGGQELIDLANQAAE